MNTELTPKTLLVSAEGGVLEYLDAETGEVLNAINVPSGIVRARPYLELAPAGVVVQIVSGLFAVHPKGGFGRQRYGKGSHDTGANPDYRPTSASRLEREMRVTVSRLQSLENRLMARERSLASVQRIPTAPVETQPAPAPITAPAPEAGESLVE